MRIDDGCGRMPVAAPAKTELSWIDRCPGLVLLVLYPFLLIGVYAKALLNGMADQMVRVAFFTSSIVITSVHPSNDRRM